MNSLKILLIAFSIVCMTTVVWACSVPVFRYALERWPNDKYEVFVFHKGPLSSEQQKLVADLTEEGAAGKQHTNVKTVVVDVANSEESEGIELWKKQETETLPWLVVKYPSIARMSKDVWSGKLTSGNIAGLLDSPARHAISRRLLKGETAVWVLLETGRQVDDDIAIKTLQSNLLLAQQELELPEIDKEDIAKGLVSVDETGLMLKFSTLRLSRTDPKEKMFVEMLLGSEDDLRDLDEPMAFPVFGRGRILYSLIGKGINANTIRQTCQELIGPCTCEVKDENPGIDIITSVDWENLVKSFVEIDREMPPLPGFGGIVEVVDYGQQKNNAHSTEVDPTHVANAASTSKSSSAIGGAVAIKETAGMNSVLQNVLILTGVCGVAVLLMSFFFLSRKAN